MEIAERRIKVKSRSDVFYFIFLADLHVGSSSMDYELAIQSLRKGAHKANHYFMGIGDTIDAIGHKDPRYVPAVIDKNMTKQGLGNQIINNEIREAAGLFTRHTGAGQLLGLLAGNHEDSIIKHYAFDPTYEIVRRVNESQASKPNEQARYLGYNCLYRIWFERTSRCRISFTIHAHHGWGSSRTAGGNLTRFERHAMQHSADLHLYGHCHDPSVKPLVQEVGLRSNKLELSVKESLLVLCPTYNKTLSEPGEDASYAEKKGYPLRPLGDVVVAVKPDWQRLRVKAAVTEIF